MERIPKYYKRIERGIFDYYVFELNNGNYILYDKKMRNPIEFGSIKIIDGLLERLSDKIKVTYYDSSKVFGFKKNNRQKPKFNKDNALKDLSGKDSDSEWVGFNGLSPVFYYFELEGGKVALFDEEMGQPVMINSMLKGYDFRSKVNFIVSKYIKKTSTIYYFKQINGELKFRIAIQSEK